MTGTRKKASAIFFAAIMVVSMVGVGFAGSAAAVAGASAGANVSGNVQEAPVSPASIDEGQQQTVTFAATFTGQTGNGDTDTVNLTFSDEFAGQLSENSETAEFAGDDSAISDTSSITTVDGPDQDGNLDTVQAQYDPTSDGNVEVQFVVGITAPNVASTTTYNPEFSYADSDDTNASTSLDLEVTNTDNTVADGPVENVDTSETFDTIQDAVNDAGSGDTIEVDAAEGPYNEQVVVDTPEITLQSVNGQANVTFNGDPVDNDPDATLRVNEDGVVVDGFQFNQEVGDAYSQSVSIAGDNVVVQNSLLTTTNAADETIGGLEVNAESENRNNVTLLDNTIESEGQGIYTDLRSGYNLDELTVENNDVTTAASQPEFKLYADSAGSEISNVNGVEEANAASAQIEAILEANPDIQSTQPYGVVVSPTDVTVGDSANVEADILGRDDANPRVQDVSFIVENTTPDQVASGSTSSNSFSTLVEFSDVGDYTVSLDEEPGTTAAGPNAYATPTATVSSQYTIEGFEVSPSSPSFGDNVQLSGQIVDGQGDGVEVGTINLVNVNASTTTGASASTTSSGNFSFTASVDDTATFGVGTDSDSVFAEFDVAADDASLTFDSDSTPQFDEESTFNVQLNDSADDPIAAADTEGYLNVTGPFAGDVSTGGDIVDTAPYNSTSNETAYVHVETNNTGGASFALTPVGDDVSVSLENMVDGEAIAGLEATNVGSNTGAVPDYVADSQSVTVGQLNGLNVEVSNADNLDVATNPNALQVAVTGSDGNVPGGMNSALANATVNVTAPGVDAGGFYDGSMSGSGDGTVAFNSDEFDFTGLTFEEAGTATVTVTAQNSSGAEFTSTEEFDIAGDILANVTPTDVNVQENSDVTVEVTNSEGTPVNNRVVALTNVTFGVNTSSGVQNFDRVVVDGSNGAVYADTDGSNDYTSNGAVDDAVVVNDGTYVAENISFESTGSVDVDVYRPGNVDLSSATQTIDTTPIEVSGVEAYEVQSDVDPTLAGGSDQLNLTVTEDGKEVNGSLLTDISNNVAVTQNGTDIVQTAASTADLDDDGTVDTIQVTIRAENADEQVDIELDDGNDRTGATTVDVVAPSVTAAVDDREGNLLTEGLNSTVDYTVEDPRDGSAFDSGTLTVEAVNATLRIDEDQDGTYETTLNDGDTREIDLDADGQATVFVGAQELADDADSPALLHNAQTASASTGAGDVALPVESPSLYLFANGERTDVPSTVEPESSVDYTFEVTDANDWNIPVDGVNFTASGAGLSQTTALDEGFVDVAGEVTSGTIDLTINDGVGDVSVGSIDALETADLNLTAGAETVEQNGTVEFRLERLDRDRQTIGQLNITDADDNVITSGVEIDGTQTVTFNASTYDAGNYTVEATKTASSQKSFNADTVNVTVEPSSFGITNTALEPDTVTSNTTNDHTLTFDALKVTDDGNTDTFTVDFGPATVDNANDVSVVDANGDTVSVTGSPNVDNGSAVTFSVSPDSSASDRDLTVEVNATVTAPNVSEETAADVTITLADSSGDETSATTTLTVQPEGSAPTDPTERALQITGKDDPANLTQDDVTIAITEFERGNQANGVDITQDDVTTIITLFERN
ncbi:beta strand repeat-containing protein [Halorubrum persicum]|nr:surface glycoprotein [Halorubrum persicum]